jgi:acyl carrier protein
VDRAALPEPEAPSHEFVAPGTPMQELIAALWTDALQLERTGATDNFFDLGGHSLAATRVVTRLRDVLDCVVPVRLLFEHPVLADFAAAVEELALAAMTEPDQPTETTGMPR